ncbi:MAG: bifunctional UDP-N-acetylglucosamine diphosphorylase/glucosamine-1-phosphate N-acetyltransferase GlmU [Deltaproteobacteria bacterium]|nr:bifunctional UDP-N-acetylglucosamine diphosphorylase/glucosamine-1-phosphate N-acetyltransferase GlmU [Deltaproteobacteria bacterium]
MEMLNDKITAVILAAGQGTRMKSSHPKVLHQILGRPMIAYLLDTLINLGIEDILVVVGYQAEKVQEALKDYPVRFVVQEPQLGTGHAVQVAMVAVPPEAGDVLVLCGDAPLISRESINALHQMHKNHQAAVTIQTVVLPDGLHYGRVVRDDAGRVTAVLQSKDSVDRPEILAIREINTGAYCFDTPFLRDALDRIPKSPVTGEIYLTDLIHIAREQGRAVEALIDQNLEDLLGINSRAELAAATQTVKRKINARHMDQGVTLVDPETNYIESLVTIGRDTVIYPNVYIQGRTVIGENCVIEASVKIVDSTLENDVHVKMGCVVTQSRLGAGVDIGPFAHLRPLSDLRQGVHVGNFVEVKKSVLHEGVKAGHLTYLGDAEVGAGTNVGAGTITCNYDGVKKHQTIIEEGAFIGSNTALVAPVTIGAGAYVGAGSTITKDVPPGKLGISRARQVNLERRLIGKKKEE